MAQAAGVGPRRNVKKTADIPMKHSIAFCAAALSCAALLAQSNKTASSDGDWPMYSRDHAGSRYSPLQQINTDNVAQLTQAWSYRVAAPAPARVDAQPSAEAESLRSRPRTTEAGQARGGGAPRELNEGRGGGATDAFGNPPGNPEATP